eukprot:CAMPEP_0197256222 /NCGR_PEP_ID=MMETSP1429-20130617/74683_1 /TAXON_ID=49237 /ORGANISM="Chaetoceros  sp., Strain UNC1202" /LENGTH=65 /DNA_ID=CAMNT_0042719731 /DNA_START=213 /DNA_END=410 /DNA_ORIENTATION=+
MTMTAYLGKFDYNEKDDIVMCSSVDDDIMVDRSAGVRVHGIAMMRSRVIPESVNDDVVYPYEVVG